MQFSDAIKPLCGPVRVLVTVFLETFNLIWSVRCRCSLSTSVRSFFSSLIESWHIFSIQFNTGLS